MLSRLILYAFLAALTSWYVPATIQRVSLRDAESHFLSISQEPSSSSLATSPVPMQMPTSAPTRARLLAYTAPPPGTWSTLPNTAIWPVIPIEAKECTSFNPGCGKPELWSPWAIFAYSGGDLATLNGILGFLYWGGGHADSADNSLYFAPFDGSGPRRLMGPYLSPAGGDYRPQDGLEHYTLVSRNQPGVTVAAAPKSRHTYNSLATVIVNGKPYFFAVGGGMASRSGFGSNVTRMFDLSQSYAEAMARPDMGWARKASSPAGTLVAAVGVDTKTNLVVVRGRTFWAAYNPVADSWTKWADVGGGGDNEAGVAMDIGGRKMYVLGGNIAEVVDLDTHAVRKLGTWDGATANGPDWVKPFLTPVTRGGINAPGLAWHPGRQRIIVYANMYATDGQQSDILQIDPVKGTIETLPMGGVPVTTRRFLGIYGRFRLIPGTDAVVLAGSVDTNVFIGQLPASGTTSPPASRPTGLLDAPREIVRAMTPATSLPRSWR